ncbi:MAG: 1-deoxy-D-xylulose-5-phosphate reductoisomerase, partial [Alphaproteobacteria bacterium]|nr:1-deoxy-D-xylulose-5-phosphate reductoisomerase [Alphaproteobacteria bacterium]
MTMEKVSALEVNSKHYKRTITILGSTGSVGKSTVDLLQRHSNYYSVEALTAKDNVELLAEQARQLNVKTAVIANSKKYQELKNILFGTHIEVAAGEEAVVEAAARPAEWVMAAIMGAAGLEPTMAAVQRGAMVALANKECLVCAGELMMMAVKKHNAVMLPVDSEHNAIFQVFDFDKVKDVEKIILTASGGPFRLMENHMMEHVTPAQALAHPIWSMGAKISIDSATMMNKGLELIEAHHLFGLPEDKIDILIHPQSIIHSMVSYIDGSVLAQLGTPDMRIPIAYALSWPKQRISTPSKRLDLAEISELTFTKPDVHKFPALSLVR